MSWVKWMRYGGMEIGNEARTLAYIRAGLLGDSRVHARDCACDVLEDEYGPFVDPVTDEAPWYTSARAESGDFLGLLIDRIELTSPWARSVTARGGSGSVLGPQRLRGRVVSVTGNLYAASPEAMDYGKRWLSEVLRDCNSLDGIGDLCLMPECPEDGVVNMFRTLKRAALIDGPTEVLYPGVDPCVLTGVRFQLATEVGWLFTDDEVCMEDQAITAGETECCMLTTEEWIGDATARIEIVAGAPNRVESLRVIATPTNAETCIPPEGSFVAASDATSATGTLTITKPTGTADGDVIVVSISAEGTSSAPTLTPPAGWTALFDNPYSTNGRHAAWWKRASTEGASWDWAIGAAGGHGAVGIVATYRGISDVSTSAVQDNASSTSQPAPTVDAQEGILVGVWALITDAGGYTAPTGMTERREQSVAATQSTRLMLADEPTWTEGATGTRTATASSAAVGSGALIALRAPSGPTPCSEFVVSGLKPGTKLVIDGAARTVEVQEVTSGRVVGGLDVVTMADGGPFDWVDVGACSSLCLCLRVDVGGQVNSDTRITVTQWNRET